MEFPLPQLGIDASSWSRDDNVVEDYSRDTIVVQFLNGNCSYENFLFWGWRLLIHVQGESPECGSFNWALFRYNNHESNHL
jgi:hypothetical protein